MVTMNEPFYGLNEIIFNWSSDSSSPTYYIYIDGLFEKTTLDTSYTLTTVTNGNLFRFEVYDEPTIVEKYFPNYFNLNFFNKNQEISKFIVSEKVGSSFIETQTLNTIRGTYYYSINTRQYADETTAEYRIEPYFNKNNEEGINYNFVNEVITYPSNVGNKLFLDTSSNSIYIEKYDISSSETFTNFNNPYDNNYTDTSTHFGV